MFNNYKHPETFLGPSFLFFFFFFSSPSRNVRNVDDIEDEKASTHSGVSLFPVDILLEKARVFSAAI